MRFSRAWVASLAIASAPFGACRRQEPPAAGNPAPASSAAAVAAPVLPDPFVYAAPRRTTEPPPLRFLGRLPVSVAEMDGDWAAFPPRPAVTAALCAGDRSMQTRLLAALRTARGTRGLGRGLAERYAALFGECESAPLCDWLVWGARSSGEAPAVREVFWRGLTRCHGPATAAALESDAAPDEVVVDAWFERAEAHDARWTPRLARAATTLARSGDPDSLRKVGVVLGRMPGPEPVDLIRKLQAQTRDPAGRALLALGLGGNADPRARGLHAAACAHSVGRDDLLCQPANPGALAAAGATVAIGAAVRDPDADVERLAAALGRGRVADAAEACARDRVAAGDARANCLERLARLDRPRAGAVASALGAAEPPLGDLARALARFPDPDGLPRRLRDLRLLPDGAGPVKDGQPLFTAEELLLAHGRATNFDTEADRFPIEHDGLLHALAALAGEPLAGVAFEEVAPADDDGDYALRAWLGGFRYEVRAENLGDSYDVEAVLGLLNALLRERHSDLRFVALATGDDTATVAVGPRDALVRARDEGLLAFDAARRPLPEAPDPDRPGL
jgi:hypothetical protein